MTKQSFKVHFYKLEVEAQDIEVQASSIEEAILLAKEEWRKKNKPTVGDIEDDTDTHRGD